VYKSIDGGRSWKNVGLGDSQHVGKILVDPRDSDVVWVAAQGPLWNGGGDRGLYKTTDGGATWTKSLAISDDTGVSDVVFHPQDPDTLYATAWQRRRHVWTVVSGGPEGAIYKSTDGGASWRKVAKGLPEVDLGRIGLAVTPAAPDWVYAVLEAADGNGGFYRSTDRGESWEKRSGYVPGGPQYYNELVADPKNPLRVYSMDVWIHVTDDGGKSFRELGEWNKHSDNHALWIDPAATDHLVVGCDGGLYETFDGGKKWRWIENLPTVQFYKVAVDDREPFYHVYGGTQDNFSLGGPSRTDTAHGITNADWFVTIGGDGFQSQVDPEDPNIVYSQFQYGRLSRYDRRTGQEIDIQPQPGPGEEPLKWNWDSPLIISPHSASRLYFGANRLFRSDDRGDTWRAVSPDLTRKIDRNKLAVMGRVWSVDAVSKNRSTSFYGNLVALDESPRVEGLLYAGTDDGLVQVSEDDGGTWRAEERFPGVPEGTYVNDLAASLHQDGTVYAAFNNHKKGDFKPYLLKSTDRGRTWHSIAGDLPERGSVYSVVEDHVEPNLLFAGTEFGVFFTVDGGKRWVELTGEMPTVAARDLVIQRRENDLVVASFGRGFFVLDDYSPLRGISEARLAEGPALFPVKDAWMFIPRLPLGLPGKGFQGESYYSAPNPPFGAVFTYYLKEGLESLEDRRQAAEEKKEETGEAVFYPTWDELRKEAREPEPAVILTVTDESGAIVRRLTGPVEKGIHRVAWDLRWPAPDPATLEEPDASDPFADLPRGPLAVPGRYTVRLAKKVGHEITALGEPQTFEARPLGAASLPAPDRRELLAFQQETAELWRAILGASRAAGEAQSRLDLIEKALLDTPRADLSLLVEAEALENRLKDLLVELEGDPVVSTYSEPTSPSVSERVQRIVEGHWASTSAPTATQQEAYRIASEAFARVLGNLRQLIETDLAGLEARLEAAGAPWTPGRLPTWPPK
ncbi:MAG: glycosyl hydrolase, partial [Acidobacteria bacterium]|nr:glycosyl hydrolase [Acidobacteriota bacterium]